MKQEVQAKNDTRENASKDVRRHRGDTVSPFQSTLGLNV